MRPSGRAETTTPLLQAGFRPFFLLGSLYVASSLGVWLAVLSGSVPSPGGPWPAPYWHGHEMLFGYVATAIGGFLLTSVPNWTDTETVRGRPLALLVTIWMAGRGAMWLVAWLPAWLVAVVDIAFFPALAVTVAVPIWRSGKRRNYPVVGVLVLLTASNTGMHLAAIDARSATMRVALHAALFLVVVLVTIISGRIVPLFTRNALRRRGVEVKVESWIALERALVAAMAAAIGLALAGEGTAASGWVSVTCGILLIVRQSQWQPHRTLGQPILWVLHVGHLWLAVAFLCHGVASLWPTFPATTALHAFGAGSIGTMVLGVMSRVALGHTGRTIEAPPVMVIAYGLVILGGLMRVFGPLIWPGEYLSTVIVAGTCWGAGNLLFAIWALGMLTRPRADAEA